MPIFSHRTVLAHAIRFGNSDFVRLPASGVIVWLLSPAKPCTQVQIPS